MNVFRRVAPLVVLVSLLVAAPPALADQTIATVTRPTFISAFEGHLVWSSYRPGRGYILVSNWNGEPNPSGQVFEWPVEPRPVPFDVDANPTSSSVFVYSRCRREPTRRPGFAGNVLTQLPEWQTGRGCDLYRFDPLGGGGEKRIAGASSRHASEFLPTVWKNRIVFARVYEERKGLAGKRTYFYERPLAGKGRSRRLPVGARSTGRFCSGKPVRCRRVLEPGPTSLDLRGNRLAFGWDSYDELGPTSSAYLVTLGRRPTRRRIVAVNSGDIQGIEVVGTTLAGGYAWSGVTWFGDRTENELGRFSLGTHASQTAAFAGESPFGSVLAAAVDGSQVFYLRSGGSPYPGCSQTAPCDLRAAALPPFTKG
jgi:hypothetical protein